MDSSHLAVLLLMLGLALLVAEIFIPSGGLLMTASIVSVCGSVWFAWHAWWHSNPVAWWMFLASLLVLMPACIVVAFYFVPRTSVGRRILLEAPAPEEVRAYAREQERLGGLVGRTCKTLTLLNPGGLVMIDGERLHCESEGVIVDPGTTVVVVGVSGNRLIVRQAPERVERPADAELDLSNADKPPLDFDLPQG